MGFLLFSEWGIAHSWGTLWAVQGLNLRPFGCEPNVLPLN